MGHGSRCVAQTKFAWLGNDLEAEFPQSVGQPRPRGADSRRIGLHPLLVFQGGAGAANDSESQL